MFGTAWIPIAVLLPLYLLWGWFFELDLDGWVVLWIAFFSLAISSGLRLRRLSDRLRDESDPAKRESLMGELEFVEDAFGHLFARHYKDSLGSVFLFGFAALLFSLLAGFFWWVGVWSVPDSANGVPLKDTPILPFVVFLSAAFWGLTFWSWRGYRRGGR
jgi:hypothetical protein